MIEVITSLNIYFLQHLIAFGTENRLSTWEIYFQKKKESASHLELLFRHTKREHASSFVYCEYKGEKRDSIIYCKVKKNEERWLKVK